MPPSSNIWWIRDAVRADCSTIVDLVHELAAYEHLEHTVRLTPEALERHLFGPRPFAVTLMGETPAGIAGFALYFFNYSTFRGLPGIYLEDLFVRPEYRGLGLGKGLLRAVAQKAIAAGCGRVDWAVLDWNTPSIGFYESLGARGMTEWTTFRLTGDAMTALATSDA